jgi:phospholipase C
MDRFDLIRGCSDLSCYSAYSPKTDAPTLAQLARSFVISDRTFSSVPEPSFGAHLELVAATNDGFLPKNPVRFGPPPGGPGWGCDSGKIIQWRDAVTGYVAWEPACIPFADGSGTFLSYSPVPHVPTIMDRLDVAGRTWKIYAATPDQDSPLAIPYGWAICPSFADCIETSQRNNMAQSSQVVTDAQTGALPNFSVVLPNNKNSQHNGFSMLQGDNWIGQVVSAIMHGPDWGSTAIFITYDDCGCFYDHVAPPPGAGIRMPMVIVSPYARPAFTDHGTATFASMLAYTEHVFDLPSLGAADQYAYDYSNSFDYAQTPLPPIHLSQHEVSRASRIYVRTHPLRPDET